MTIILISTKKTMTFIFISAQMSNLEFYDIFKNIFSTQHLRTTASEVWCLVDKRLLSLVMFSSIFSFASSQNASVKAVLKYTFLSHMLYTLFYSSSVELPAKVGLPLTIFIDKGQDVKDFLSFKDFRKCKVFLVILTHFSSQTVSCTQIWLFLLFPKHNFTT